MNWFGLDFEDQKSKTVKELKKEFNVDACQRLLQLMRDNFTNEMMSFTLDVPESEADTKEYLDRYFFASSNRLPFMHLLHYWATMSGLSCHEIMYGGAKPKVPLFGEAQCVVERFAFLVPEKQGELLRYLQEHRRVISNPVYTQYIRNKELAFLYSHIDVHSFWLEITPEGSAMHRAADRFFDQQLYPNQKIEQGNKHWLTSIQTAWFIPLILAPSRDIGLDYFVMQDYSKYALLDGEVLSEEQELWLSAFLMASEEAQKDAVAELLLVAL